MAEPAESPGPVHLSGELAATINSAAARRTPIAVSYVDDAGRPQLSLRGTVQVYGVDQLALWARSPGLPRALAVNPHVALLYEDWANRTLYSFTGRGRPDADPAVRDRVFENSYGPEQAQDPGRAGTAVIIEVDTVRGRGPGGVVMMARAREEAAPPHSPIAVVAAREGIVMTQMLIVADTERSVRFYRDVLGATLVRENAPAMLRLQNGWIIINVAGGPTPDKPEVTVAPPEDLNRVASFMNIRVADIDAVYRQWSARGAAFVTGPLDNHGAERRCYLRDPDGYLIEVGQTTTVAS